MYYIGFCPLLQYIYILLLKFYLALSLYYSFPSSVAYCPPSLYHFVLFSFVFSFFIPRFHARYYQIYFSLKILSCHFSQTYVYFFTKRTHTRKANDYSLITGFLTVLLFQFSTLQSFPYRFYQYQFLLYICFP